MLEEGRTGGGGAGGGKSEKKRTRRAYIMHKTSMLPWLLLSLQMLVTLRAAAGAGRCPDVASCEHVCMQVQGSSPFEHESHCSTSNGHGTYTARCCEGEGRVCPSPPCDGSTSSKAQSPLAQSPLIHPSFFNFPFGTEGLPGFGDEGGAAGKEGGCSRTMVIRLTGTRRSYGLRDDVFLHRTNCYLIKAPADDEALKVGLRRLSGSHGVLPTVFASTSNWPGETEEAALKFVLDDDDVAYAHVRLDPPVVVEEEGPGGEAESRTLFLKLQSAAEVDYQMWLVQESLAEAIHSSEPEDVWFGHLDLIFLNPVVRSIALFYLILGALVAMALSQRRVQVLPKAIPIAYVIWLAFGPLAGHRFYLNRTASGIIWYFSVVAIILGLVLDHALIRMGWSEYVHHHLLWLSLLALCVGGMLVDFWRIPSMVNERTYWERSHHKRRKKKMLRVRRRPLRTVHEEDEESLESFDLEEGEGMSERSETMINSEDPAGEDETQGRLLHDRDSQSQGHAREASNGQVDPKTV